MVQCVPKGENNFAGCLMLRSRDPKWNIRNMTISTLDVEVPPFPETLILHGVD